MMITAINILDMIDKMGESYVESWLSLFSCPQNLEIEQYLTCNAIDFAKRGISITYLIFGKDEEKTYLLGYYTITYKILRIDRNNISRTTEKKIARFGEYDSLSSSYSLPAPLIAQFGKNYTENELANFHGADLMTFVLDQIIQVQRMVGGRLVYLECEDNPFLLKFYSEQGFIPFSKRYTDNDDSNVFYHQLLKILK